jgi:DNA-binding MurR/RpiR family transcriptional regulator
MDYEKRGDAMIFIYFFLFFPLFQVLAEFAKLGHERGLPIVVFTDNEYSPLSCYASLALKIPRENILFTTSISALTVLLNAIATEIALKKRISSVYL